MLSFSRNIIFSGIIETFNILVKLQKCRLSVKNLHVDQQIHTWNHKSYKNDNIEIKSINNGNDNFATYLCMQSARNLLKKEMYQGKDYVFQY